VGGFGHGVTLGGTLIENDFVDWPLGSTTIVSLY
jgi:hypothetical protein